jgi:hypothetical protein
MRLEGTPLCFLSSTLFPALSVISWVIKLKWIRVLSKEKKGERVVEGWRRDWEVVEGFKNHSLVCFDGK